MQAIAALFTGKATTFESLDSAFKFNFRFYKDEPLVCLHRPLPAIETVSGPKACYKRPLREFNYNCARKKMQANL